MGDITSNRHLGNRHSVKAKPTEKASALLRQRVFSFLGFVGPRTVWEISVELGLPYTTASARVSELKREGRVVDTGETRPTPTGRKAGIVRAVSPPEAARRKRNFAAQASLFAL